MEEFANEEFYDDETKDEYEAAITAAAAGDDDDDEDDDDDSSAVSDGGDSSTIVSDKQFKEDISEDPNEEQRYCICKDVSYGDMIFCDNRGVSVFFFVYSRSYKVKFL